MALELTHIRFARHLCIPFAVTDPEAYYAGAVYSDSRYITKLNRRLTHGSVSRSVATIQTLPDFEKGIATHVIYDEIVGPLYREHCPWPQEELEFGSRVWMYTTAEKIIEDQISYDALDKDVALVQYVHGPTPPNNEDPVLLARYYSTLQTFYTSRPTLEKYQELFEVFGIPAELGAQVIHYAGNIAKDSELMRTIADFYELAIAEMKI